jgi:GT2 family glycosyltransferase
MVPVTFCVLLYGDHLELARQCLDSIHRHCSRDQYRLTVGSNAIAPETREYLRSLDKAGLLDRWIDSPVNLNKCPMMRRMFETVDTDLIWWFDDDSFITGPEAFEIWIGTARNSPDEVTQWGQLAICDDVEDFAPDVLDPIGFVRSASWYRGLPPPSWRTGGKGEFDWNGRGTGDGRWFFTVGGCWLIRTSVVRALDWPDSRILKMGDDVFLGEAIRQHGSRIMNLGSQGVAINTAVRRGDLGVQPATIPAMEGGIKI